MWKIAYRLNWPVFWEKDVGRWTFTFQSQSDSPHLTRWLLPSLRFVSTKHWQTWDIWEPGDGKLISAIHLSWWAWTFSIRWGGG